MQYMWLLVTSYIANQGLINIKIKVIKWKKYLNLLAELLVNQFFSLIKI
jgi:hypothetical protein